MKARAQFNAARSAGFSLMELMISVGLLSVIVYALYAMFNQTQKAFHQSLSQVDVTEGSRSALELLAADIEKAASVNVDGAISLVIRPAPRLPAYASSGYRLTLPAANGSHPLPLSEIFFMYRNGSNQWQTAGYFLGDATNGAFNANLDGAVGLYKFDDAFLTNPVPQTAGYGARPLSTRGNPAAVSAVLESRFNELMTDRLARLNALFTRAPRLIDGVVFFHVTASDREGRPYLYDGFGPPGVNYTYPPMQTNGPIAKNPYARTNSPTYIGPNFPFNDPNAIANESAVVFRGTNFPAAIDIELGVMDTKTLARYRGLPIFPPVARQRFLENNAAQIVTLRQRVNLRTAPFLTQ